LQPLARIYIFIADPMMAEAYALCEGLCMDQRIGCNKSVIQSDNSQVLETMQDGGFSSTSSAAIFYDCVMLAIGFAKVEFEHCKREENLVAH
jgi:hypothetical protein